MALHPFAPLAGDRRRSLVMVLAILTLAAGCGSQAAAPAGTLQTDSVYNRQTGKLEQLTADLNGDGKNDVVAFMDGTKLKRIEIDRNGDGTVDRWEEYGPGVSAAVTPNRFDRWAVILSAEQSDRPDHKVNRREFYTNGVVVRVEEDVDLDGRVDKWEFYEQGTLKHVDLDLAGKGKASQRLVYGSDGNVERIEVDPDGDGTFVAQPSHTP